MDKLFVGDVKKYLRNTKEKFHFCLSDPPYELGIINNSWDKSGIAFDTEFYELLKNAMIPGAFCALYGFSRTHHRVMVALEEAGWIIHKAMFAWIYPDGNAQGAQNAQKRIDDNFAQIYGGFCKCGNISPMIRKQGCINHIFADSAKEVIFCEDCKRPVKQIVSTIQHGKTGGMIKIGGSGYGNGNVQEITEALTVESQAMKGYYYGLGWGKPALEPIIVAQTPYRKRMGEAEVSSVIRNGTGVIHKLDKHPGNFLYMHDPDCTKENCSDGCLSRRLTYDYTNFYYDMSVDLDSHVISHTKARAERHQGMTGQNTHPSVKPMAINEYLGKIFLPPELYGPRLAFNPFAGSGSEMLGLKKAGWDKIVGVENNREYAEISAERCAFYFPGEFLEMEYDEG